MRNPFKTKRYEYWTEIIRSNGLDLGTQAPPFSDQRWRLIHMVEQQDWQQVFDSDGAGHMAQYGAWLVAVWEREL